MKAGDRVRRRHIWDGTALAGKPEGPALTVKSVEPHRPVDGSGAGNVVRLVEDADWVFEHNLYIVCGATGCVNWPHCDCTPIQG